jgi:hypothetical protein
MSIKVDSTTDTPEQVTAAMAGEKGSEESVESKEDNEETEATAEEESDDGETSEEEESEAESDEETEDEESESEESDEESEEEESEESDDDDEESDEDAGKKQSKKRKRPSRTKRLADKLSHAEREAEYWKNKALQGKGDSEEESEKSAKTASDKPNPDDFESHDDYIEALTDWKVEKKLEAKNQKDEETNFVEKQKAKVKKLNERIADFEKTHEDFLDVIEGVGDIPISPTVQQFILDSEHGPAMMYELANDPDYYEELCHMAPLKAAAELGKIEDRVLKSSKESSGKKETKTRTTKAPKPPTPVTSKKTGAGKKSIYDENLSQKEYEALRAEQEKGARA